MPNTLSTEGQGRWARLQARRRNSHFTSPTIPTGQASSNASPIDCPERHAPPPVPIRRVRRSTRLNFDYSHGNTSSRTPVAQRLSGPMESPRYAFATSVSPAQHGRGYARLVVAAGTPPIADDTSVSIRLNVGQESERQAIGPAIRMTNTRNANINDNLSEGSSTTLTGRSDDFLITPSKEKECLEEKNRIIARLKRTFSTLSVDEDIDMAGDEQVSDSIHINVYEDEDQPGEDKLESTVQTEAPPQSRSNNPASFPSNLSLGLPAPQEAFEQAYARRHNWDASWSFVDTEYYPCGRIYSPIPWEVASTEDLVYGAQARIRRELATQANDARNYGERITKLRAKERSSKRIAGDKKEREEHAGRGRERFLKFWGEKMEKQTGECLVGLAGSPVSGGDEQVEHGRSGRADLADDSDDKMDIVSALVPGEHSGTNIPQVGPTKCGKRSLALSPETQMRAGPKKKRSKRSRVDLPRTSKTSCGCSVLSVTKKATPKIGKPVWRP